MKKNESLKLNDPRMVTISFRVPSEFKKIFKIAAATHEITQSDLLQQVFEEWHKKHK